MLQSCVGATAALSAIRSAASLSSLLLGVVKASIQQLQEQGTAEGQGLLGSALPGPALPGPALPEALPGQAPGCGELLKSTSLNTVLSRWTSQLMRRRIA